MATRQDSDLSMRDGVLGAPTAGPESADGGASSLVAPGGVGASDSMRAAWSSAAFLFAAAVAGAVQLAGDDTSDGETPDDGATPAGSRAARKAQPEASAAVRATIAIARILTTLGRAGQLTGFIVHQIRVNEQTGTARRQDCQS